MNEKLVTPEELNDVIKMILGEKGNRTDSEEVLRRTFPKGSTVAGPFWVKPLPGEVTMLVRGDSHYGVGYGEVEGCRWEDGGWIGGWIKVKVVVGDRMSGFYRSDSLLPMSGVLLPGDERDA